MSDELIERSDAIKAISKHCIEIVAHGNCARCGKPIEGNSIFLCDECKSLMKGADDE